MERCRTAIKAMRHALPIIVVMSSDPSEVASLAYANGAAVCLTKPVNATELEIIFRALREPRVQLQAA